MMGNAGYAAAKSNITSVSPQRIDFYGVILPMIPLLSLILAPVAGGASLEVSPGDDLNVLIGSLSPGDEIILNNGIYEIDDDEALIVETELPTTSRYWQILVADDRFCTVDWMNRQSSLNDVQAQVDPDGRFRDTAGPKCPERLLQRARGFAMLAALGTTMLF